MVGTAVNAADMKHTRRDWNLWTRNHRIILSLALGMTLTLGAVLPTYASTLGGALICGDWACYRIYGV